MRNALAAMLVSVLAATSAVAQTNASPPEQPPAGDPGKFQLRKPGSANVDETLPKSTGDKAATTKPATRAERRAARKEKRAEKVGDKPLD